MSAHHEARINDALKQLGEEFRLGMVQQAEYRSRRRMLLESWGDRDATTSPGSARVKSATTTPNRAPVAAPRAAPAAEPAPKRSLVPVIIVVALAVVAAVGYALFKPKAPPPSPAAGMPAALPESPQVAAVRKAADDFLAAGAWEPPAIEQFLQQWRALDARDRAQAAGLPSMRTLRYKLDQNIQAESSLVAPDAPPEQRQRLTMLEAFARELAGETP